MTFNEEFVLLKNAIDRELVLDETTIKNKVLELPKLYHKYLVIFTEKSLVLKHKKASLEKVFADRSRFYREEYERDLKVAEIEKYVFGEEQYHQEYIEVGRLETICRYLEDVLKRINGLSFDIKNYIELRKFFDGS